MDPNKTYRKFILGLDIGSFKISACLCEVSADHDIQIRGVGSFPSIGLIKGKIVYLDEFKRSVKKAIQKAQTTAGVIADDVITTLPSWGIKTLTSTGTLTLSDTDPVVITDHHRTSCLKHARSIPIESSQTVLHMLPVRYEVDGVSVQHPVGMSGKTLKIDTLLVLSQEAVIDQLTDCLKSCGLHISGLLFEPLASAQVLLTDKERQRGAWILDMGGRFTKLSFFKHDSLQETHIIPIGGDTLTSDLSICLKLTPTDAERVKLIYGDVRSTHLDPNETIRPSPAEPTEVKRQLVYQIIVARVTEWIGAITSPLKLDQGEALVLGGNGTKLSGLKDSLNTHLNHPLRMGPPTDISAVPHTADYVSALGAVIYGLKNNAITFPKAPPPDMFNRFNRWIKNFI